MGHSGPGRLAGWLAKDPIINVARAEMGLDLEVIK
jgi:hypothetical protein